MPCKHTRFVWSPRHGGCLMLMAGSQWCCSMFEGEYPTRKDGERALSWYRMHRDDGTKFSFLDGVKIGDER